MGMIREWRAESVRVGSGVEGVWKNGMDGLLFGLLLGTREPILLGVLISAVTVSERSIS